MTQSAVVLAGGGVAGIAWEIGVLRGLQEAEPDACRRILSDDTLLVGTSAGSAVAAQVASGAALEGLFGSQVSEESAELFVHIDLAEFGAMIADALAGSTSPEEARRRLGVIARDAETVPAATRLAIIAARLPSQSWPDRPLLITAVDTATGELRVFDRDSGVDLVDAVAASCAVPGVWPTVEIDGRHYMDGGMRTIANADLAAGSGQVLILVPGPESSPAGPTISAAELDTLAPARIHTVFADADAIAAFGPNPLDPGVRRASALAGRDLGRRLAPEIVRFWR
ncbi:patatin-like phospholipase family protein [Lacisediminihabitans profunda]|uniref:Patatin-like phospholipase family protein n=1 Tax=Lacisediminihabitans profunda TaxID=2594790 RepID=A0A5C8UII5_9MICO|nr:patatin-like phospholipase family protein [Lacisediminihabitans profunda]TXN28123.1 patatin-like phospholipase family protein [Lacisediminihabitans profunda]